MFKQYVSRRRSKLYQCTISSSMIIDEMINKVKEETKLTNVNNDEIGNKKHRSELPYIGDKGAHILRSMGKYVRILY